MKKMLAKIDDGELSIKKIGYNYILESDESPIDLIITPDIYEKIVEFYQQNIQSDEVGEPDSPEKTSLEIITEAFDKAGIHYHKVEEEGYTYISRKAEDDNRVLKHAGQLDEFIEFDPEGNIASY